MNIYLVKKKKILNLGGTKKNFPRIFFLKKKNFQKRRELVTDEGTLYSSFVFNDQPPKYDPQMNFLVPAGYFFPRRPKKYPAGTCRSRPRGVHGYPAGKKYPAGTKKFIWGSYLGG